MTEIETARLHLRPLMPQDLEVLARIYRDPEVMQYRLHSEPASREQTQESLDQMIAHWQRYGFGRWATICFSRYLFEIEKSTQNLIGHCGLEFLADTSEVEVNYLLDRPHWGKGLATEAARKLVRYGFERLGRDPSRVSRRDRLVALAKPENLASRRVMEKIGMQYEKTVQYFGVDWVCYGIDRDQWECFNKREPKWI
ncbi:GNAT family N-acetyltransferase [Phormidesmis sp. 146-35]